MLIAGIHVGVWAGFFGFVLAVLALDLGVFHRKAHEVKVKEALVWSGIWVVVALVFNALLVQYWDAWRPDSPLTSTEAGTAFLAGYIVEKALSIDNVFVFLIVFSYFQVPAKLQHRVLFWGILGALFFRSIFVAAGSVILEQFLWATIVFGLFLIGTGIKLALTHDKKMDPGNNPLVKLFRRFVPVTEGFVGEKFMVVRDGKRWATPLLLALVVIEFTDVVFAVDSIPAIFAITSEPFIVLTSNVFAILGLRSLYFAISAMVAAFRYLSFGLAAILVFVGGKMIYGYFEKSVVADWPKFPVGWSLSTIALLLGASVAASLLVPKPQSEEAD
ncbi:MAG: TerC family protein [Fimbriimonadaceae bacterium]